MLLKEFSSISKGQQTLACGIQMKQHLISKAIRIQTLLDANWTEKHKWYMSSTWSKSHLMEQQKQACVALSTAEAKYIAAGSCCAQICWLKQQLSYFGLKVTKVPLLCDNTSAINLTKILVHHSRSKHIEIRHHFIREKVSNDICEIKFIEFEKQLADFFH